MQKKIEIITHRGLEPSRRNFYPESSYEAFENQLNRDFRIEFDIAFVKEEIIIFHDSNLKRITDGKDKRAFEKIELEELKKIRYGNEKQGRISTFNELMELIRKSKRKINALHFKGKYQKNHCLDLLIKSLKRNEDIIDKIIIFDVKPKTAKILKVNFPELNLAPSVAHEYDIKRYNSVMEGTLISVEEAIAYKNEGLYDWVWLDEWDLVGKEGRKKFYTKETFEKLKQAGYKIALVTPELHGTSPGLLGGEAHEDTENKKKLFDRIKEILDLTPDAICTDYPEEVKKLIKN